MQLNRLLWGFTDVNNEVESLEVDVSRVGGWVLRTNELYWSGLSDQKLDMTLTKVWEPNDWNPLQCSHSGVGKPGNN